MTSLQGFLFVGAALFCLGLVTVLSRRNAPKRQGMPRRSSARFAAPTLTASVGGISSAKVVKGVAAMIKESS